MFIPSVPPVKITQGHIGTDTDRSATKYDFLLVINSNRGPISYRF